MDYSVSKYSRPLSYEAVKPVDIVVIKAKAIRKNGIILSLSVDAILTLVNASRKVIIEINRKKPELYGIHDIYRIKDGLVIKLTSINQRIGKSELKLRPSQIWVIVNADEDEENASFYSKTPSDAKTLSENIWKILEEKLNSIIKFYSK